MAGNNSAVKVNIDHVVKKFNGRTGEMVALNGVDLQIYENEFVCVVGPSGCGKSTLLNIIGGLEKPTEGSVTVDGKPVEGPGPDRGIVFQQYALFPWLTVEKNIQFGLKLQGKSKEECEELTHKYLKMVVLENFAKHYPKEIVDIDIPYPRDQKTKMSPRFLELKNYIWNQVYQEYLEVRK